MASRLCKLKENIKQKKYTLRQYGAGIIFFISLYIFTQISGKPLCLVQNLFGASCFGCGMTRGFIAIMHLDFPAAFRYNVLSIPLFLGICLHAFLLISDILSGKNRLDAFHRLLYRKWMCPLYGLLLIFGVLGNNGILF